MPSYHCLAVGCTSSTKKWKQPDKYSWMHDVDFFAFPKAVGERRIWWRLLRRGGTNDRLTFEKLNRYHRVCSAHFVDGKPTLQNPYPTLYEYNAFKGMKSPRTPTRVVPSPAPAITPKRSPKPLQPRSLLVNLTSPKPTVQLAQGMKLTKVHTHYGEVSSTVEIGGVQDASLLKVGSGMPLKQKPVIFLCHFLSFFFFYLYSSRFIFYLLSYKILCGNNV